MVLGCINKVLSLQPQLSSLLRRDSDVFAWSSQTLNAPLALSAPSGTLLLGEGVFLPVFSVEIPGGNHLLFTAVKIPKAPKFLPDAILTTPCVLLHIFVFFPSQKNVLSHKGVLPLELCTYVLLCQARSLFFFRSTLVLVRGSISLRQPDIVQEFSTP